MGLQKNGVETLNSRGYCQTRIDQDTKIHMDVSICITALNMSLVKPVVKTANPNPYETLDRIEHIGESLAIYAISIFQNTHVYFLFQLF